MPNLLIRDGELVVTMTGEEIAGGWVAIAGGLVEHAGGPGSEPEADQAISARDGVVTRGLTNTHHPMFQTLTRSFAPVVNSTLFGWLTTLYPLWSRLDEEAAYLSAWIGLAELALGGCTTTTDHLYVHPKPNLIDAEIAAAREVGLRFHPTRGSMSLSQEQGGLPPRTVVQDEEEILTDSERLTLLWRVRRPGADDQRRWRHGKAVYQA